LDRVHTRTAVRLPHIRHISQTVPANVDCQSHVIRSLRGVHKEGNARRRPVDAPLFCAYDVHFRTISSHRFENLVEMSSISDHHSDRNVTIH
jgi:hypothetical protein